MSNIFSASAFPLPTGIRRGMARFASAGKTRPVRHALGYDIFVEFIGMADAARMSAEDALTEIESRAGAIRKSGLGLERSAIVFLGNKVIEELPEAEWRVYGTHGLEIATGATAFDVARAVRAACDGSGDPREGLRRFLDSARSGRPEL